MIPPRPAPVLVLAALVLAPLVVAQGPARAEDWSQLQCDDGSCTMLMRAAVTAQDCTDAACVLVVDSTVTGSLTPPGLLYVSTETRITAPNQTTGSVCVGPKQTTDLLEPYLPCGRTCEKYVVGTVVQCVASTTRTVEVPRGGACVDVWVSGAFVWNGQFFLSDYLLFVACQLADGTPVVVSYNGNQSPPPPSGREPPQRVPPWAPRS